MGLAPARNTPTGLGSAQLMTCGRTSTITARRLPARRLHVVSAFSSRRLLVALWPNALLFHDRWGQLTPSSCGFAAATSTSGSPARLRGNSNARPFLHVCDTSRTAACARRSRRSSVDRQLQREQRPWPTRLTSGAGRTRWPQSNAAESRPNALRQRQREHWSWSNAAESWPNVLQRGRQKRWPPNIVAMSWTNALRRWRSLCWPRSNTAESRPNPLRQRRRTRWPRSNATKSRHNALRQRRSTRWPQSNATKKWQNALQRQRRTHWPGSNVAKSWPNALRRRQRKRWPRSKVSLGRQKWCWQSTMPRQ